MQSSNWNPLVRILERAGLIEQCALPQSNKWVWSDWCILLPGENLVSKFRVHNIGVGIHNRGHVLLLKAKQDKNLLHTHIHYLKLTASISKVEQIYAKIYISETAHTLRTAQGSTVPCVGWNLGFERKLKMTTVKKFRREKRSRRQRYVIIIPPKACSPYLDDRYQSRRKVWKSRKGGEASCNVVAITCPTPPWFIRLNWYTKIWWGK